MGPEVFGHVESTLKSSSEAGAGMAIFQRQIIGLLELAENFRFAQNHRIHSTGNPEQVLHTLRLVQAINLIRQRIAIIMDFDQEFLQCVEGLAGVEGGRGIISTRLHVDKITASSAAPDSRNNWSATGIRASANANRSRRVTGEE